MEENTQVNSIGPAGQEDSEPQSSRESSDFSFGSDMSVDEDVQVATAEPVESERPETESGEVAPEVAESV